MFWYLDVDEVFRLLTFKSMEVFIMKCIKRVESDGESKGKVIRVTNEKAWDMVHKTSLWKYTNKREWKEGGRKR